MSNLSSNDDPNYDYTVEGQVNKYLDELWADLFNLKHYVNNNSLEDCVEEVYEELDHADTTVQHLMRLLEEHFDVKWNNGI